MGSIRLGFAAEHGGQADVNMPGLIPRGAPSDPRVKVDDVGPIGPRPASRRSGRSVLALVGVFAVGLFLFLQNGRKLEDSGPTPDEIAGAIQLAESSIEARKAYDSEALITMVADEGAAVMLMFDNVSSTAMPVEFLTKREIGFALEAEEIYGVEYNQAECSHPEGPPNTATRIFVSCVYEFDSKMRRLALLPPLKSSFDMTVERGQIVALRFPTLNISFDPGGRYPVELARFVSWIEATHPDVANPDDLSTPSDLFSAVGQELVLQLDRDSIDLLDHLVDEYGAAFP